MQKERVVFLDYLRVAACFMVMAIHAAEPFYLGGAAPDVTYVASKRVMAWVAIVEVLCRAAVPLFAMASAYLLFPVERPAGEFLHRRLLRVGLPFAAWSLAYTVVAGGDFRQMFFNFPGEAGHLWFVPMLFGLYLLMPLLSPWARQVSKRELGRWIALWLFTTAFPFLRILWRHIWGEPAFGAMPYLWGEAPWNHFGAFHYVSGFAGYMLLGLWFRRFAPAWSLGRTLCAAVPLFLAGAAITGIPFFLFPGKFPFSAPYAAAVEMERSIEFCSTGVALSTIAVFMVLRNAGFRRRRAVETISRASYGMYLVHMFFLAPVSAALAPRLPTPLAIASAAAVSFALSGAAAIALKRVPFLRRLV